MASASDCRKHELIEYLGGGKWRQYAEKVVNFSSQYGGTHEGYCAANLAGPPTLYPKYGDFVGSFVLRTYGSWWLKAPSAPKPITSQPSDFLSQDFVELEYVQPVVPTEVVIYETYNPGTVVRILACNSLSKSSMSSSQVCWEELWSGPPQDKDIPCRERAFRPPIKELDFATKLLRLEFCHITVDYYMELDAVELIGKEPEGTVKKKKWHDRAWGFALGQTMLLLQKMSFSNRFKRQVSVESCHGEVEDLGNGYFDWLPDETVQHILGYLDLRSLCRAALVCRFFCHLCYDPMLTAWRNLDLQPYWPKVDTVALSSLELRCKHLLRLSLSWTGGGLQITEEVFCRFIKVCGPQLTCLRLACCQFIRKEAIATIASVCENLEELDLQSCQFGESHKGRLKPLAKLKGLQNLNFYNTPVSQEELLAIIKSNHELQHLNVGSCQQISDCDKIACALAENCKGLLSLDVWRSYSFTSEGVDALASGCPQLLELDLGWTPAVTALAVVKLAERCRHLRKLFLTATRLVDDTAVRALADSCPDLEQFDILGANEMSPDAVEYLLRHCSKLFVIDLSFCGDLTDDVVAHFRRDFPNLSIKKSFE